jgi:hypothetical protein
MTKEVEVKTVKDIWDMECPKCGRDDRLHIVVQMWAHILIDGTDADGDQEWDADSGCKCNHCDWHGLVKEATYEAVKYTVDGHVTEDEDSDWQTDGQYPPFAIFDVRQQKVLEPYYPTREDATKALVAIEQQQGNSNASNQVEG